MRDEAACADGAAEYAAENAAARDVKADYVALGHSIVCGPWGDVVSKAEGGEECVVTTLLDLDVVEATRNRLPIINGARPELYARWSHL